MGEKFRTHSGRLSNATSASRGDTRRPDVMALTLQGLENETQALGAVA